MSGGNERRKSNAFSLFCVFFFLEKNIHFDNNNSIQFNVIQRRADSKLIMKEGIQNIAKGEKNIENLILKINGDRWCKTRPAEGEKEMKIKNLQLLNFDLAFDAPGIEAGHWNTSLTTFSLNRLHDAHAGQP